MPLFRRRRDDDPDEAAAYDETQSEEAQSDEAQSQETQSDERRAAPGDRPTGPWDVDDIDDDEVNRLDLGALRVPVPEGCEVRVDVQEEQVVAATVVDGRSALQIHAFAAPRSEGIWDDVRAEIAESLRSNGGSAEESEGPFGPELRARLPVAEGAPGQPARFLGVDGPRWFLRGLMTGVASTDPQQAHVLEGVFRGVVVVRGGEAMAPRDLLPLRLPREALAHLDGAQPEQPADTPAETRKPTLEMLERGPEITETR